MWASFYVVAMDYKVLNETVSSLGQVAESIFRSESALSAGDSLMGAAYAQKARVCLIDALVVLSAGIPEDYSLRNHISSMINKTARLG